MRRKLLLLLLFLSFTCHLHSQDNTESTVVYEFTSPAILFKCTSVNGYPTESEDSVEAARGHLFYLIGLNEDGSAIIQYRTFKTDSISNFRYVYENRENRIIKKKIIWRIPPKDFATKARKRFSTSFLDFDGTRNHFKGTGIVGGFAILPYKIRPRIRIDGEKRGFDFSKDITLGVSGGIKQRLSHYAPIFLNAVINAGISDISLNEYNTKSTLAKSTDVPAFTISSGLVFDFKNIQLGAFFGWDKISDRNLNNWIYQGKTWYSVGFGFSIFSVSTSTTSPNRGEVKQ